MDYDKVHQWHPMAKMSTPRLGSIERDTHRLLDRLNRTLNIVDVQDITKDGHVRRQDLRGHCVSFQSRKKPHIDGVG